MLGAICGDVLGSTYEWHNIKYCPTTEELLSGASFFTDDSVMTIAVALGISDIINTLPKNWMNDSRCKLHHENPPPLFLYSVSPI